ncbi:MAG: VLRF1 family aeRF1-type release factor [Armatimonadota bacterium]|nr:VLRF1 family aeRF1-type release factor [Armatimonadota bacterium]MDR5697276.1 VLRF1 family aeRF1-type release factor [Armatimonadota bacterium]
MLHRREIDRLIEQDRRDVLTVCLDTDPTKPENQRAEPAYRIWLRQALGAVLDRLPREKRREFSQLAQRVEAHIRDGRSLGRGIALYAAADLWKEYVLPVPVANVVRVGRPDVWPLLWASQEYPRHVILTVHRDQARLLVAYLGDAEVVEEEVLDLDTHDWRFKSGRPPSFTKGLGTGASRGAQRDTFDARVDAHLRRFWAGVAQATAAVVEEEGVDRLVIGGPEEAANATRDLLPETVRGRVVAVVPIPPQEEWPRIRQRVLAVAREAEARREAEVVRSLLEGEPGTAVVGVAGTLAALNRRQVATVVADRDLGGEIWQCDECGYATGERAESCPVCEGAMSALSPTQALPLLAYHNRARIEVVDGEGRLRPYGGLGALLRYEVRPAS